MRTSTAEDVVVTATRIPAARAAIASPVSLIERGAIDLIPSQTIDGVMRSVPTVATFRRSSSLVADPTSQGLNLRGIGPSGVSRTLVLLDGVPVNDAFGGWIYWRALPRLGIDRVEIVPGGGSAVWGSYALGGVVQLVSREIEESSVEADASFGSFETLFLGARAAGRLGDVGAAIEGELLRSDGHQVVAADQRGAIDGPAESMHGTLNARLEAEVEGLDVKGRVGWFREDQNGGTVFTDSEVEVLSLSAGAARELSAGRFSVDAYAALATFEQRRARVAPDRSSESLAAEQRIMSREIGGSLSFASLPLSLWGEHVILGGADFRHVSAALDERRSRTFTGIFVQDQWSITGAIDLIASMRVDFWRSAEIEPEWSPRLGVTFRPLGWLLLRAAGYRAFRAPTLNELYRPFQVGTVRTAANDQLTSEHLIGAEAGFDLIPIRGLMLRATGFWNQLDDPVVNVTLADPLPDGSERRRENLGRAVIAGAELDLSLRLDDWRAGIAYAYVHATSAGRDLPQDPRHRGNAYAAYDGELFSLAFHLRAVGAQYEDDRNELRMNGFAVVDVLLDVPVGRGFEIFGAVENLLDQEYVVGRAGVDTIGQPRLIRGGIRLRD